MGKFAVTILAAVLIQTAFASSPAFLWNVKSGLLPSALNSDEFAQKLATLSENPLVVFVQDELSVEDFSVNKASLPSIRQLGKTYGEKTAFVPALEDSINLIHSLKREGYRVVNLKENEKVVPETEAKQLVFVVRLPEIATETSRTDALKKNDGIIKNVFDVVQRKYPNVVGVFVGKQNPMDLLSGKRVSRSLLAIADEGFPGEFHNVSGEIFLFFEKQPQILIYREKQSIFNFTLESPTSVIGDSNVTEASVTLSYGAVTTGTASLTRATVELNFSMKRGKWSFANGTIDFNAKVNGTTYANVTALKPVDWTTPRGFSYHCSRIQRLGPATDEKEGSWAFFEIRGIQLQPFHIKNDKFGDWYDCEGFFSVGIWAGILLGLMIAAILAWAVSMLADIKTPDRFDDPKGKPITINASE